MSNTKRVTPNDLRPNDIELEVHHPGIAIACLTAVEIDGTRQKRETAEHRIDVERTHFTPTGERYRVIYLGETLVEGARAPLFDACRALQTRGVTGTLVMYSRGGTVPRAKVDIEKGAESTIIENAKEGPRFGRYRPYPSCTGEDEAE